MPTDRLTAAVRSWLVTPFQAFVRTEATGGILLLVATAVALAWANGPLAEHYVALWETHLTVGVGEAALSKPLHLWINDGLMALFFLLVGLEIKREMLAGELASLRQAAFPLAAAVGGVVVPAGIYAVLNAGTPTAGGWAIPMATDIAFALGVLTLLGPRVPLALKVFLTALAIADDLGAVLVIALFYTSELALGPLAAAGGVLFLLALLNRTGVRHLGLYLVLGVVLWLAVLKSGVHATVAGVLLAMTVPARRKIDLADFARRADDVLSFLLEEGREEAAEEEAAEAAEGEGPDAARGRHPAIEGGHPASASRRRPSEEAMDAIHGLEVACSEVDTPLARLEHALHPWSAYAIMPIFALANAGVVVGAESVAGLASPMGLGILAGLFLGKQAGVTGFAWLAERLGWAARPEGVSWVQVHGVACLCGIGFTMSLFITGLAFPPSPAVDGAKLAILLASLLSGGLGWMLLSRGEARG